RASPAPPTWPQSLVAREQIAAYARVGKMGASVVATSETSERYVTVLERCLGRWWRAPRDSNGPGEWMRIARVEYEHSQAVRHLLEVGLREQEQFAGLCSPPEDEDFFETEFREHLVGLEEEPEAWRVALDSSGEVIGVVWL